MTEMAIKKLNDEKKAMKGGQKDKAIAGAVLNALCDFCRQNEEFARAVYRSDKSFGDCCVLGDGREKTTDLYQSYARWADANNEYKMSSRKFGQEMARRFERTKSNGAYYYNGIILADAFEPYQVNIVSD